MPDSSLHDQFMDLLVRHQSQVFGYIFAAVHNLHDAEEIYQETSLVLWRRFSDYQPNSDFVRWACQTAKHKILHFQQGKRRSPICFDEEILSAFAEVQASRDAEAIKHRQELLAGCVDELPPADQELVKLCYNGLESIKQVAEKLQRAPKTLYNSISRIRRILFDCVRRKLAQDELVRGQ